MNEKYACYVRVSTDRDEQVSSVENQIDICRNWLERHGYSWNGNSVYKDEGISGTILKDRPAIQLLLEKAKKKEINMVLFKSISRLARDLKDALEIREIFLSRNVRIISIEEGYDSDVAGKNDMSFEMASMFADHYSRMLSGSVSAALAAKVRRGEHIGKIPFGYSRENGKLQIKQDEAEVVTMIFDWYVNEGLGFKTITRKLNELNLKPKEIQKWQVTSVQTIIRNRLYCGDFVLNRYTTMKVEGKKKQIQNPESRWIIFKEHHEPIVSREWWEKANSNLTKTKKKISAWNDLRGILKCSECGSSIVPMLSWRLLANGTKKDYRYMKCSKYRRMGEAGCINHSPMLYEDVKSFLIKQLLEKSYMLQFSFEDNFQGQKNDRLSVIKKEIEDLKNKGSKLIDLHLEQIITKEEFKQKRDELDWKIKNLENEQIDLSKQDYATEKIENIKQAFDALSNDGQNLHHAFRTLLDRVVVHPQGEMDIYYTFNVE
ncbi:recombinase family protein [Shimazuella kribbensis]|uniref:recombinase family protein n=1 Tax=Shimazuella kribbensis TaxID=139808 RepID=UPI000420A45F|nr:recombinase family protein [Shimazuella kribbensis]